MSEDEELLLTTSNSATNGVFSCLIPFSSSNLPWTRVHVPDMLFSGMVAVPW